MIYTVCIAEYKVCQVIFITFLRHTETSGWEGIPCGHVNMPGMRHVELEELSEFKYLQPYRHLLRDAMRHSMRLMVPGVDISIEVKGQILQLLVP